MTFVLGLTGSIGMGKSTTAQMFADEGLPVWDADATVHRLYQPGQPAADAVKTLFPSAMDPDGSVNRAALRALIQADKTVLDRLNAAVHPLVAADRAAFLAANQTAEIVLLDVPLLYEIGLDQACDAVAVVSARLTSSANASLTGAQ
jgi:dephospho-CoA kinase